LNNLVLNIDELPQKELPILSDKDAGEKFNKWSYLYAYYPNVLRDIFLISRDIIDKTKKDITIKANELRIDKQDGKQWIPWNERYVLEYINTLKKVGFWDEKGRELKQVFANSEINSILSDNDIEELKEIFFSYFRFRELSSWFIDPSPEFHSQFDILSIDSFVESSKPIYFYNDKSRFYNSFLFDIENPNIKYLITDDALMRFWDVFIKWGTTLNTIDKFNVSRIFKPVKNKEVSMAYFIRDFLPFDFETFISNHFNARSVWIPELIYKIVKEFRYSVNDVKKFIVHNIISNDKITFERTSEIFLIKGKNSKKNIKDATYLYPLIDGYYISNLIMRK